MFRRTSTTSAASLADKHGSALALAGAALSTFELIASDLAEAAEQHFDVAAEAEEAIDAAYEEAHRVSESAYARAKSIQDEHDELIYFARAEAEKARSTAAKLRDLIGL